MSEDLRDANTDIRTQLQEKHGRLDLSHIESGDTITVTARRYIHEPEVFTDVEETTEQITFTVARKTHPSGTSVKTHLWEANSRQANSNHWNLSDTRDLCDGVGIDWFIEEIAVK